MLDRPTFYQWLALQRLGNRPVRAIAMWVRDLAGAGWPKQATTLADIKAWMVESRVKLPTEFDHDALDRAWRSYQRCLERGNPIPRVMGPDPLPPELRRRNRGFMVAPQTPQLAKQISAATGESIGRIIDRLVMNEARRYNIAS